MKPTIVYDHWTQEFTSEVTTGSAHQKLRGEIISHKVHGTLQRNSPTPDGLERESKRMLQIGQRAFWNPVLRLIILSFVSMILGKKWAESLFSRRRKLSEVSTRVWHTKLIHLLESSILLP